MGDTRSLLELINRAVSDLEELGAEFPALSDTSQLDFTSSNGPQIQRLAATVCAAALQLAAIFEPPQISLLHVSSGAFKTAALRVCLEGNVTEILREAGPKGLHVREIAMINGLNPGVLARLLRYLASVHVYQEVSPDTFANNRISAAMDTGKSVVDLIRFPETKHDNTNGFPAFLCHQMDEVSKGAMYSWETMTDSRFPFITPLEKALSSEHGDETSARPAGSFFDFLQRPEQTHRHRRFVAALEGMSKIQSLDCLPHAYAWGSLPENALVVDVGGGSGTVSLELAKRFPKLRFVVQDLSSFVEKGKALLSERHPEALESGRTVFQAHDFFTPQPQKNASIFLLRHVIHNWSDDDCIKILSLLREAAREDTKLLILEIIMPYACRKGLDDISKNTEIPGATAEAAPIPLLPNFGAVNEFAHVLDMTMFSILKGASERTIDQFSLLLSKSGWKLIKVNRLGEDAGMWQAIEAVPVLETNGR
ncbi:S-adenosyl-L-methionine-dependent methyltransferase [Marasmius fiardii PR-910]|nr:S-adenosyl-L-methionine-dependent methyltransferase [Marasmius fiardii PR-910]